MKNHIKVSIILVTVLTMAVLLGYVMKSENNRPLKSASNSIVNNKLTSGSNKKNQTKAVLNNKTAQINTKKAEIIKYAIKSGDTLESIAKTYGVTVSTIAQSNGLSEETLLKIGKELIFPSVNGILYRVKSNETLWDLALEYDVRINDIVSANNMDSPDKVKIGQQIIIPGAKHLRLETKVAVASAKTSGTAVKKTVSRGSIWPVRGRLSSMFGPRWGTRHEGIDIAVPTGTDVDAFMGGTVVSAGWNSGGYGNLVIIDHGNGLETYYGHNSKILVRAGESVRKGQHIADSGSTGDSTGPHLHFEVRKNDVPVNPLNYLR